MAAAPQRPAAGHGLRALVVRQRLLQLPQRRLGKLSVHHFEREALIKLHLEHIKRLLHHRASDVKIIEPNTGGPQESLNEHSERKNYV